MILFGRRRGNGRHLLLLIPGSMLVSKLREVGAKAFKDMDAIGTEMKDTLSSKVTASCEDGLT
jgi:hypothetical protein